MQEPGSPSQLTGAGTTEKMLERRRRLALSGEKYPGLSSPARPSPTRISHWRNWGRGQVQSSLGNVVPCHTEQNKRRAAGGGGRDGSEKRLSPLLGKKALCSSPLPTEETPVPFSGLTCQGPCVLTVNADGTGTPAPSTCHVRPLPHSASSVQKAFPSSKACALPAFTPRLVLPVS